MFVITQITNVNILSIILWGWVVNAQLPAATKEVILEIPDGPYFDGNNVIITCKFKFFEIFDEKYIRIEQDDEALLNINGDINDKNILNIIYTLEIQNLSESHTGLYKCKYYSKDYFVESEPGKYIRVWPIPEKPKCQASPSHYTEGETVNFTCIATAIYPSLKLQWNTGDTFSTENPHIISIASKDIDRSEYRCDMTVRKWDSAPLVCKVNITRLLNVTINISNVTLGQPATLECIVQDTHQNLNYIWISNITNQNEYQEINNDFKCNHTNCSNTTNFLINGDMNNILIIHNVTEDMNNAKITCEVAGPNIIGNNTIILQINGLHETKATTHGINRLYETEAATQGINRKITTKISTTEMNISHINNNQQVKHEKNENNLFQLPIIVTVVGSTLILHICIYYIKKSSNSRRHQSNDTQSSNLDNISSYITAPPTTNASSSFNATLNNLDKKKSDENVKIHIYHDISKTSDDVTDGYLIPMCRIEQVKKEGTPKHEDQSQDIKEHLCNVMVRSTSNLSNADKNVKTPDENTYHYISTTSEDVTDGYLTSTKMYYKSLISLDQQSYQDQSSVAGQHKQYEELDPLYLELE